MPKSLSSQDIANLNHFDLNLIVVFELIYSQKSLTKTAQLLNVSPPAISKSLSKLRIHFQDPLFIKNNNRFEPTILAEYIHNNTTSNLHSINDVVNFGPHISSRRTFSIYSPPTVASLLVSNMKDFLENKSSDYELIHRNIYSVESDIENLFRNRKADMVISLTPVFSASLICEPGANKKLVLSCNNNYKMVGDHISADRLLEHRWITTLSNDSVVKMELANFVRDYIKGERDIIFSSDSILPVLTAIQNIDAIGIISEDMLNIHGEAFNLRKIETDFELPSYSYNIIYHRNTKKDLAFNKLIDAVKLALNNF
ncbi:LysR family transcriptional regulator [Salmonella enterica subsp. enterica serovar Virchow]|nr:LysR family transcriptional regulator [Salmonella enterica subsp. enterica serovar Virchow]